MKQVPRDARDDNIEGGKHGRTEVLHLHEPGMTAGRVASVAVGLHLFQQGDEMKAAAHEQRKRKRVQRHCGCPLGDGEPAFREAGFPLLAAQIVVRQTHAMGAVAHPVHELQRLEVEGVFAEMVFDEHEAARDAARFPQQDGGIVGVVQHVNRQANVERPVGKRQLGSVERPAANRALGPWGKLHSFNGNLRAAFGQEISDGAIAAANVQNGGMRGDARGQNLRQDAYAPAKDHARVRGLQRR